MYLQLLRASRHQLTIRRHISSTIRPTTRQEPHHTIRSQFNNQRNNRRHTRSPIRPQIQLKYYKFNQYRHSHRRLRQHLFHLIRTTSRRRPIRQPTSHRQPHTPTSNNRNPKNQRRPHRQRPLNSRRPRTRHQRHRSRPIPTPLQCQHNNHSKRHTRDRRSHNTNFHKVHIQHTTTSQLRLQHPRCTSATQRSTFFLPIPIPIHPNSSHNTRPIQPSASKVLRQKHRRRRTKHQRTTNSTTRPNIHDHHSNRSLRLPIHERNNQHLYTISRRTKYSTNSCPIHQLLTNQLSKYSHHTNRHQSTSHSYNNRPIHHSIT